MGFALFSIAKGFLELLISFFFPKLCAETLCGGLINSHSLNRVHFREKEAKEKLKKSKGTLAFGLSAAPYTSILSL